MKLYLCIFPFLLVILAIYQNDLLKSFQTLEEGKGNFFRAAQMYLPVSGIYLPFLFFRMFIGEEIAEVLGASDKKSEIRFSLYLYFMEQVVMIPFYAWYFYLYSDSLEILRLVEQAFFLHAALYGLFYLFQSVLFGFLTVFLYCMIMLFASEKQIMVNIFYMGTKAKEMPVMYYPALFVLAFVFLLIGLWAEKKKGYT